MLLELKADTDPKFIRNHILSSSKGTAIPETKPDTASLFIHNNIWKFFWRHNTTRNEACRRLFSEGKTVLEMRPTTDSAPRETRYPDIGGCEISEVNKWSHPATVYVLILF